jgi:hypothetical protein
MTDEPSVLLSTKHALGLMPDYVAFDPTVILFINGALSTLNQLGVGPDQGLKITGANDQWIELLGDDPRLELAKTYVYLKVRLVFDPPDRSFVIKAWEDQLLELAWRIKETREVEQWTKPVPLTP